MEPVRPYHSPRNAALRVTWTLLLAFSTCPANGALPWFSRKQEYLSNVWLDDHGPGNPLHDGFDYIDVDNVVQSITPISSSTLVLCNDTAADRSNRFLLLKAAGRYYEILHIHQGSVSTALGQNCDWVSEQQPTYDTYAILATGMGNNEDLHVSVYPDGYDASSNVREAPQTAFSELVDDVASLDTKAPVITDVGPCDALLGGQVIRVGDTFELGVTVTDFFGASGTGAETGIATLELVESFTNPLYGDVSRGFYNYCNVWYDPTGSEGEKHDGIYLGTHQYRVFYEVGAPADEARQLKVRAWDLAGNPSELFAACAIITGPNRTIGNLEAVGENGQVRVRWTASGFESMVRMDVLRSDDGGVNYSVVGFDYFIGDGQYEVVDDAVVHRAEYCYKIFDHEIGPGPQHYWGPATSSEPSGLPEPPAPPGAPNVYVTGIGPGYVDVQISGSGCVECEKYRFGIADDPEGPYTTAGALQCVNAERIDGLENGREYWVKARGASADELGPWSVIPRHFMPLEVPQLISVRCYDTYATLSWTPSNAASGYVVEYWSESEGSEAAHVMGAVATGCTVTDLAIGERQYFAVRAVDAQGNKTGRSMVRTCEMSATASTERGGETSEGGGVALEVLGNPVRYGTALVLSSGTAGHVSVEVLDAAGRVVARVVDNEFVAAGAHLIRWRGVDTDGRRLGGGVYFAVARLNGRVAVKKLVVLGGGM